MHVLEKQSYLIQHSTMVAESKVYSSKKRKYESSSSDSSAKIQKVVKRAILSNEEKKYKDTLYTGSFNVSTNNAVLYVTGIATGTDNNARVGRSVTLASIQLDIIFRNTNTVAPHPLRIAVIQDMEGTGTAPLWGDVYDTTVINPPYQAFRNMQQYPTRFRVLLDEKTLTNASQTAETGLARLTKYIDMSKKRTKKIYWSDTGALTSGSARGAVYVIISCDGTPDVSYQVATRVTFYDS